MSAPLGVCPRCGEPMQGSYCGTCEAHTLAGPPSPAVATSETVAGVLSAPASVRALAADLAAPAVLTREAEAFARAFRFLRHSRACRTRHHPGVLTWMDAEEALAARAATMHQLAAKAGT